MERKGVRERLSNEGKRRSTTTTRTGGQRAPHHRPATCLGVLEAMTSVSVRFRAHASLGGGGEGGRVGGEVDEVDEVNSEGLPQTASGNIVSSHRAAVCASPGPPLRR